MPLAQGSVNLCSSTPEPPPKDLASKPGYVQYSVEVIDPSGAPTNGLKQSDFVAVEDGVPIPIAFFREDRSRPPASIGILVNKSGTMVSKLPIVKSAVAELLKKIDPCDEVYLYAFGTEPILVQDFTTQHDLISARFNAVDARGWAKIYDSLKPGLELLKGGHFPDKILIIFTDGGPKSWLNSGNTENDDQKTKRADLVSAALNTKSRIFVVGVGNPDASRVPVTISIGTWSAGSVLEGIDVEGLRKLADSIEADPILILSSEDKDAAKVSIKPRARKMEWFFGSPGTPYFRPLAVDPNRIDQVAASIASQIDDHYTIGVISATKPNAASTAPEIAIKLANRSTPVARTHRVQLNP